MRRGHAHDWAPPTVSIIAASVTALHGHLLWSHWPGAIGWVLAGLLALALGLAAWVWRRREGRVARLAFAVFVAAILCEGWLHGESLAVAAWMVTGASLAVALFGAVGGVVAAGFAAVLFLPSPSPWAKLTQSSPALATELTLPVLAGAGFVLVFFSSWRRARAELKEEVERRREAEQAARASSLTREELLARIIHDLRTPMNGVVGLSDLLLRSRLDARQREQVSLIARQADVFLTLVNDLLDFAQLSARRLEIRRRNFDLRALAEEAAELIRPATDAKGVALAVRFDPRLPERLHGDADRIRQILNNLLSNAGKFTERGSIDLEVAVEHVSADATHWVRLEVRDSGPGIPAAKLAQLFRPFTQVHDSQGGRRRGSGLGLAISANLAQLMQGTLTCESEAGRGSTFRLSLPLGTGQRTRELTPATAQAAVASRERASLPLLVVEDDLVSRKVLEAQLSLLGLDCVTAERGAIAVDRFVTGRYLAVLLDWDLPDLDGFEVARRIRDHESATGGARTPIVAITANALGHSSPRWLESGMDDLLLKPYRIEELAALLSAWLPFPVAAPATGAAEGESSPPALRWVDRERLAQLATLGGGESVLPGLIELFRATAVEQMQKIRALVESGQGGQPLAHAAHRLRGSAANLGAERLADRARRLEERAQADPCPPLADEVARFEEELAETLQALERWYAGFTRTAG